MHPQSYPQGPETKLSIISFMHIVTLKTYFTEICLSTTTRKTMMTIMTAAATVIMMMIKAGI
jgi:hypothetical protein